MTPNGKAAGVLDTPTAASKEQCAASVPTGQTIGNTDELNYATLQQQFALLGRKLKRPREALDGRTIFELAYRKKSRYFSELRDLDEHLNAILGHL